MNKKYKLLLVLAVSGVLVLAGYTLANAHLAVFDPAGEIAEKQRNLIYFTLALSLIVVIPVFAMTIAIAWKYREGNTKAKYSPDWDHSRAAETIWWTVPTILISILAVVTWQSSHQLDPFKPIDNGKKPLTIQVVALQWKWLFIYPEQHIATVNYVQFPEKTPVRFEITADAPMNSFWIPRLGGQIYAMSGMSTHLNLIADGLGSYRGSSANLSGRGFAGMTFTAKSTSEADFNQWAGTVKENSDNLNSRTYDALAVPSENNDIVYYSSDDANLYNKVIAKYMPGGDDIVAARGTVGLP